jgi:hypothetical protein
MRYSNLSDLNDKKFDAIKAQYDKISNDWRHFNTIIWGIPSVAVAIMTGIIIAAYQPHIDLEGWPRIASLSLGSLLLFALTIETVKKRHHMIAMSFLLKDLQEEEIGLGLDKKFRFPVGISGDIDNYINERVKNLTRGEKPGDLDDRLFKLFRHTYARKYLTWVVFVAAVAVAVLSGYEFVRFFNYETEAYISVIFVLSAICAILMTNGKRKQKQIKLEDGETAILEFIPDKVQQREFTVRDKDKGRKKFEVDMITSSKIDSLLSLGNIKLRVTRHGSGKNVSYDVKPINGENKRQY